MRSWRFSLVLIAGAWSRGRYSQTPDMTIAACARDFLRLALREEYPDTLFFGRRLSMEGGTELGLLIKNILDVAEPSELLVTVCCRSACGRYSEIDC